MITEKYWSENTIVNTIMEVLLSDMHINDFIYDKSNYQFEDNNVNKYNKKIYDAFNREINVIEDWINDNDVSHINIYMCKDSAIENALDVDGADINNIVTEGLFTIIDDAEFQKFMDSVDGEHYIYINDVEFGFNENMLGIGYSDSCNLLIKKIKYYF